MRVLLAAAALACSLLATACGAGEAAEPGTKPGAEPPADHRPTERLVAADMAAARGAVRLGPSFLPGWHEVEPTPDTGSKCTTFNPDLSPYVLTGKARSAMEAPSGARIEFSVKIYADANQASQVFAKSTGPGDLRCIRDGVADGLRDAGFELPVVDSRLLHEPPVGADTAIYAIYYELEHPEADERQPYPVEVYVFRTGRVVGAAFFSFIADKASELRHARVLEGRLRRV